MLGRLGVKRRRGPVHWIWAVRCAELRCDILAPSLRQLMMSYTCSTDCSEPGLDAKSSSPPACHALLFVSLAEPECSGSQAAYIRLCLASGESAGSLPTVEAHVCIPCRPTCQVCLISRFEGGWGLAHLAAWWLPRFRAVRVASKPQRTNPSSFDG